MTTRHLLSQLIGFLVLAASALLNSMAGGQDQEHTQNQLKQLVKPQLFKPLTEPPCSYCVEQHRKGFVESDDPVIAWIRGAHNGGAIPIRHFLSAPRVINDTYGLFFYDPDGGYVAAFEKDYGYQFYGWRAGVMLVQDKHGTIWSALSGTAIEGPDKGKKLTRVPNVMTTWSHWLMLHPESTAYHMFDGKRYPQSELPQEISAEAQSTIGEVDDRLPVHSMVMGIEGAEALAISLEGLNDRACFRDQVDGQEVAIFWFGPTQSAAAFRSELDGQKLTFYADKISPETAPFKDKETGTRWTIAGRAVDGPLRGKELTWVPSVQCRWHAWAAEYPKSRVRKTTQPSGDPN